jgi:arylsulfatase
MPMNALTKKWFPFLVVFFLICNDSKNHSLSAAETESSKPNIVVVLCDDLGYGDLACYGHPVIQSPNIDHFAKQGIRLTNCYSAAPNCSPSRTGLMTGRTPYRVGIHNWIPLDSPMHVRKSEITIATLLKQTGYATCHVGKWHLNGMFNQPEQPQPSEHGFDHWFSTQNNALPTHLNPDNFVRNGNNAGRIEGSSSHIVTNEAIQWLKQGRDKEKPFFLFVCYHEPHEPIATEKKYSSLYDDKGKRSIYDPTTSSFAAHHGNITQMDAAFGKLMKSLDDQKLTENTFVIFTSDNGPAITGSHPHGSSGPLRDKKGHMYEGGIRVPGIIRWPGNIKTGIESGTPVCGVDLLPTLCELAGASVPKDRAIDGTSIVPLWNGTPIQRKTPLYWQFHYSRSNPIVAMRKGNWKILASITGTKPKPGGDITNGMMKSLKNCELTDFELYYLKDDIAEMRELSVSEPNRLERMKQEMTHLFHEVQEESPVWPSWKWPRIEGKRIKKYRDSLKNSQKK